MRLPAALLALCLGCAFLTGCPKVIKKAEIEPEKICYTLSTGSTVIAAKGVKCPKFETFDQIAARVMEDSNTEGKWSAHMIVITNQAIDCDGIDAMGCTWMEEQISVISTWAHWGVNKLLEHELTHQAIYYNGNNNMDHFCLDRPSDCVGTNLKWLN